MFVGDGLVKAFSSLGIAQPHCDIIKTAAKNKRIVPFLGAGISYSAGIPTVGAILTSLLEELSRRSLLPIALLDGLIENMFLESTFQVLADCLGPKPVQDIVRQLNSEEITPTHHLLTELVRSNSTECIVTTNFDSLLEASIKYHGGGIRSLRMRQSVHTKQLMIRGNKSLLIKLHGECKSIEKTVITLDKYMRGYPAATRSELRKHMENSTLLLLGYSAWDLDFLSFLRSESLRPAIVVWIDLLGESDLINLANSLQRNIRLSSLRRQDVISAFRSYGIPVYVLQEDIHAMSLQVLENEDTHIAWKPSKAGRISFTHLESVPSEKLDLISLNLVAKMAPERILRLPAKLLLSAFSSKQLKLQASAIIGELAGRSGRIDLAKELLTPFLQKPRLSRTYAIALAWLGRISIDIGDLKQAEKVFSLALQYSPKQIRPMIEHFVHGELRFWQGKSIDIETLRNSFVEVELLTKKIRNHSELRFFLEVLAKIGAAFHFGEMPRNALEVDLYYLDIAASAGDPSAYGRGLGNIGVCYLSLAGLDKHMASAHLESANEFLRQGRNELQGIDSFGSAQFLGNLGVCSLELGDSNKGIKYIRNCLREFSDIGLLPIQVYFWAVLSDAYLDVSILRSLVAAKRAIEIAVDTSEWGEGSLGLLALANGLRILNAPSMERLVRQLARAFAEQYGNQFVLDRINKHRF
jgi:NAD-dependent SIR2 family protein deacetylase